MNIITISTSQRNQVIDITSKVQKCIDDNGLKSGIVTVFSSHTTAGITVNENADPDVKRDMVSFLGRLVPKDPSFTHTEGNSDSHIKGSLINFSQVFIVEDSKIQLGTWQGIFFMEFDGPRDREVWVKIIGE